MSSNYIPRGYGGYFDPEDDPNLNAPDGICEGCYKEPCECLPDNTPCDPED